MQTTQLNYIGEIKWSSTISNRLLAEAAIFTLPVNYTLGFEPDAAPDAIATFDQIRSIISGVSPRMDTNSARMFTYAGNISYVTGSHSLKVGTQVRTGWSQELFTMRGDMLQITNNGVPNSVRLVNTPSGHKEDGREHRHLRAGFVAPRARDAQPGPPVRAVRACRFRRRARRPARGCRRATSPAQDGIVNWNTVSPRLGFVVGRVRRRPDGAEGRHQPLRSARRASRSFSRSTSATSRSRRARGPTRTTISIAQTSEINMAKCSGSLQPTLGNVDPNLKRPHQWEYTAIVQRQIGQRHVGERRLLRPAVRRPVHDGERAGASPPTYTPVTITNPLTNQPLTVYNQDPATRTMSQNLVTTIPDLKQTYNGVEFQVNTRLSKRDGIRRPDDRPRLRRQRQRRPEQPEHSDQQHRRSRLRLASADPRRLQLSAAGRRAVRRLDPRGDGAAAERGPSS